MKYKVYDATANAMTVTKTRLLRKYPWYGILIQRLQTQEVEDKFFNENSFDGAFIGTDGRTVFYVKDKFDSLPDNQKLFMLAQQVVRCILFHFSRKGARDVKRWNIAGCIVANNMLVEEQMGEMPQSEPFMAEWSGLSTEQVYNLLKEMPQPKQDKLGKQPGGCVMDKAKGQDKGEGGEGSDEGEGAVNGLSKEETEQAWKIAMEQASLQMQKRGLTSAGQERALEGARQSRIDWRDQIRKYLTVKGDTTWSKPNRRYIGRGLYLPSVKINKLGHLVFAIDTSGSIDTKMLEVFAGEINEVLSACDEWPERVTIMWADAEVVGTEDQEGSLVLHPKGGGGTAFQPTFDYIEYEEWEPQVMFYLTDLCGDRPVMPSKYPVVWVCTEEYKDYHKNIGWGDLVVVDNIDRN